MGNTPCRINKRRIWTVHPHVRGEYPTPKKFNKLNPGSSPRAWGIRFHQRHLRIPSRFIPTCVGNTPRRARQKVKCSVHPHVRGEYYTRLRAIIWMLGSSPRAWGILRQTSHELQTIRFIPTCVGNTESAGGRGFPLSVHPHVRGEYAATALSNFSLSGSSPRAWGILRRFKRRS